MSHGVFETPWGVPIDYQGMGYIHKDAPWELGNHVVFGSSPWNYHVIVEYRMYVVGLPIGYHASAFYSIDCTHAA